jgi:RNA polymerase sigma-70 factor (ECF subfamily)
MKQTPDTNDADLATIVRIRQGAKEEFRRLIERHQDRVHGLLVRLLGHPETARDIAQEAFLKAYLSLDQYRSEYRFANWLLKIAQNLAFSHLRKVGVDRERLTLDGEDRPGAEAIADPNVGADPSMVVEEKAIGGLVVSAVAGMSEKYRLVLTLRHTEGMQYQEIAQFLGIPLGTVKFRLHQAYKLLNEELRRIQVIQR